MGWKGVRCECATSMISKAWVGSIIEYANGWRDWYWRAVLGRLSITIRWRYRE